MPPLPLFHPSRRYRQRFRSSRPGGQPRRVRPPNSGPKARVNAQLELIACTSEFSRSSPHTAPSTREERARMHVLSSTCPNTPSRSSSSQYRITSPVAALPPPPCTPAELINQHPRRESSRARSTHQPSDRSPVNPLRNACLPTRARPSAGPRRSRGPLLGCKKQNQRSLRPGHNRCRQDIPRPARSADRNGRRAGDLGEAERPPCEAQKKKAGEITPTSPASPPAHAASSSAWPPEAARSPS
jgi:hypothetical protein